MRGNIVLATILGVAIFGSGFEVARFMGGTPLAHLVHIQTCASEKQFLVAFRVLDRQFWRIPGLSKDFIDDSAIGTLELDGERAGTLSQRVDPVRRFVCEGNHQGTITLHSTFHAELTEKYYFDFAVSRPSLFEVFQFEPGKENNASRCVSDRPCGYGLEVALSSLDPDDPKLRKELAE